MSTKEAKVHHTLTSTAIDAAHTTGSIKQLSICLINRQQQQPPGLLLSAPPAGDISQQEAPVFSSNGTCTPA